MLFRPLVQYNRWLLPFALARPNYLEPAAPVILFKQCNDWNTKTKWRVAVIHRFRFVCRRYISDKYVLSLPSRICIHCLFMKVKVKLSLCFNWAPRHEGVLGSGGIDPRILDLGTRWRWVVSFTPRPLYPQGKSPELQISYASAHVFLVSGGSDNLVTHCQLQTLKCSFIHSFIHSFYVVFKLFIAASLTQ
jgi:hypothetical protein